MRVTGTFLDASDQPRALTAVKFQPDSNPAVDSLGILTAKIVTVITDASGRLVTGAPPALGVVLDHGIYTVVVGPNARDKFRIAVPESDDTADITTLTVIAAPTSPVYVPAWFVPVSGNNFQFNAGKLQLKNLDTGFYHTMWVAGAAGMEQLQLDQPGDGPIVVTGLIPIYGNNYRLKNGNLQLKNIDTGLYHTPSVAGAEGFEQFNVSTPGES